QQARFRETDFRATFSETVEKVSDLVVRARLDDGNPGAAFTSLERARLAAWPAGTSARASSVTPDQLRARLPPGMLVVEYAVLVDRLVIWTVSRGGWRVHHVAAPRDSLRALAARLPAELARADAGGASALARLYDLLLRPLQPELAAARRVVVVPDRELHAVPFTALWNRDNGGFAVEANEFSTAPSAGFLVEVLSRRVSRGSSGTALVVGNPALNGTLDENLDPLPDAAREAEQVARLYPRSTLLVGAEAERGRVVALLPGASMVHFAGHAVFDADRPERSYLALAPGPGSDSRLQAGKIGGLRLSNLQVVVLSACSTINPRPSRAGGVAGLAYSFLHAGAPAIVSTLWDVGDADVSQLLVTFHRARRDGLTPSQALRRAQLDALHSTSRAVRAPRTWAAFTYTGL
ncbi:MAG TPA: CHAT domain-containing protein, partial [Longimicrobium sp.]